MRHSGTSSRQSVAQEMVCVLVHPGVAPIMQSNQMRGVRCSGGRERSPGLKRTNVLGPPQCLQRGTP